MHRGVFITWAQMFITSKKMFTTVFYNLLFLKMFLTYAQKLFITHVFGAKIGQNGLCITGRAQVMNIFAGSYEQVFTVMNSF